MAFAALMRNGIRQLRITISSGPDLMLARGFATARDMAVTHI